MPQGKSLFLPYAYGLALQLGIPTLYCPSPECYWIADDNGFREVFMNGHQSYYPTRDMLIFVDTIKPPEQLSSLGLNEGFLVQVTSPEDSEEGWKDCAKERDADAWVMTTWSREEISSLQYVAVDLPYRLITLMIGSPGSSTNRCTAHRGRRTRGSHLSSFTTSWVRPRDPASGAHINA